MNFIYQIDSWLFTTINGLAGRWAWLDGLARLFLNDYFAPTLLALALLALWFEPSDPSEPQAHHRAVLVATLSAALANTLLKLINLGYYRPRPFTTHHVHLLFYQPTDSSLPSNAAALGFAVAAGVWFYQRQWGWGLLGVASLFGLSRIFGGVHYPLDVITGALLGWGSAWFIQRQKILVDKLLALIVVLASRFSLL